MKLANLTLLEKTVNSFFEEWLVRKSNAGSLRFFSQRAFSNKEMLGEDCIGSIKRADAANAKAVKNGVIRFLKEFNRNVKGSNLASILMTDDKTFSEAADKKWLLNVPQADRYWLFRASPDVLELIEGEKRREHVGMMLTQEDSAVSAVKIRFKIDGELTFGGFYFVWVKENDSWKIIHAGMACA